MTERVLGPEGSTRRRRSLLWPPIAALALMFVFGVTAALGSHPEASLPGSNFEIDVNANLKVDDPAPSVDWASLAHATSTDPEKRKSDAPTGKDDDSYAGGAKEDDTCPGVTTGSIPNNKSDLLAFGVYTEPGDPGFLNLFWQRVTEPAGTTLMDFELNQSGTDCGNGVNRTRTIDDLLVEYKIEQGGASANIVVRKWTGSAWGPEVDVTDQGDAAGTINSTAIAAADADGLGAMQARTFGEAQIDLDFIFDETKCVSFGSAFLKSRASDSFTSQLKDYIAPQPINLTNCGKVIIRKQTDPATNPTSGPEFGYQKSFGTDPTTANTFSLRDDGVQTFNNVLFGDNYTVVENSLPTGWDFHSLDCTASTGVTPDSIVGATVTFDIDSATDILDCTYTNRARGFIKLVKNTVGGDGGPFAFTHSITGLSSSLTTSGGTADDTSDAIAPGSSYAISENLATLPAGWDFTSAECKLDGGNGAATGTVSGAAITAITVEGGKTTVCTFTNTKRGAIKLVKNTVGGDGGPFGFTHSIAGLSSSLTTSGGTADDTSDAIAPGSSYAISENVPPTGWSFTSAECKLDGGNGASTGTVSGRNITGITVQAGKTTVCTFTNTRLHKVIVIVCHEDTNTLAQSGVTLGSETKQSLSAAPSGLTQAQLCALNGASFGGLGHGNQSLTVNVGSGAH